ncbi:alpha/beta fold hydrolase, partial [Eudoraea sp.]
MPINHSIILGEGEPLCILHGFLGMSDNWKSLGNKYAEAGFEVHLIDQRNHGKSFWSDSFNYKEMSGDLKYYLEHYKIKETALIGHSMGGKTAMEFACNNPELTSKLIVADIAPRYYPPHHTQILNALEQLKLSELTSRNEADTQLKAYISDQGIRQFLLKNLFWKEKKELALRFN